MSDSILIEPAEAALAVLEELKRQRTEGISELYMEDSTLQSLEDILGGPKEAPQIPQRHEVSPVAESAQDAVASVVKEPIRPKPSEPKPSVQAVNPAL